MTSAPHPVIDSADFDPPRERQPAPVRLLADLPADLAADLPADLEFCHDHRRLAIRHRDGDFGAVNVDFVTLSKTRLKGRQALWRALGKRRATARVADLTAGLGRDAFVIASRASQVYCFEQAAAIRALLADGLARAANAGEAAVRATAARMVLVDGAANADTLPEPVELAYLDPMFPLRRKSAAIKKEMQLLQTLATVDPVQDQLLFELAHQIATDRVIVKRPADAPPLTPSKPNYQVPAGSIRFDVYLAAKRG